MRDRGNASPTLRGVERDEAPREAALAYLSSISQAAQTATARQGHDTLRRIVKPVKAN
jgi:hypothetical protein